MPKSVLIGEIEGFVRVVQEQDAIQIGEDEFDVEFLAEWVSNNLPAEGQYVRIIVMAFPGA